MKRSNVTISEPEHYKAFSKHQREHANFTAKMVSSKELMVKRFKTPVYLYDIETGNWTGETGLVESVINFVRKDFCNTKIQVYFLAYDTENILVLEIVDLTVITCLILDLEFKRSIKTSRPKAGLLSANRGAYDSGDGLVFIARDNSIKKIKWSELLKQLKDNTTSTNQKVSPQYETILEANLKHESQDIVCTGMQCFRLTENGIISQASTGKSLKLPTKDSPTDECFVSFTFRDHFKPSRPFKFYASSNLNSTQTSKLYCANWFSKASTSVYVPIPGPCVSLQTLRSSLSRQATILLSLYRSNQLCVTIEAFGSMQLVARQQVTCIYSVWGMAKVKSDLVAVFGDCCFEMLKIDVKY